MRGTRWWRWWGGECVRFCLAGVSVRVLGFFALLSPLLLVYGAVVAGLSVWAAARAKSLSNGHNIIKTQQHTSEPYEPQSKHHQQQQQRTTITNNEQRTTTNNNNNIIDNDIENNPQQLTITTTNNEQQKPTTTNNNNGNGQQRPATTNNNQQQPTTAVCSPLSSPALRCAFRCPPPPAV